MMDLTFYGLAEKPFQTTPDPHFLYMAPGHREALAQLKYGLEERKGFMLLSGEVGMGKTTLVKSLLERLDSTAAVAYVFNTMLPFDQIFEYALESFGILKADHSPAQRLFAFNSFLAERGRAGLQTVLIVDEAQNLTPQTLEQIRLLSNFETASEKLLQIVLVGQTEIRSKLELPELRQLKQRIALRCEIPPLTGNETRDYIRARLRIARAADLGLFTERALARIAGYTGGIPRLINIVCDHCLVIGYADQRRRIDRDIVEEAIAYLEDRPRRLQGIHALLRQRIPHLVASIALVLAGLVVAAGAAEMFNPGLLEHLGAPGASEWTRILRGAMLR
jgi:general secretion pathway protein A